MDEIGKEEEEKSHFVEKSNPPEIAANLYGKIKRRRGKMDHKS